MMRMYMYKYLFCALGLVFGIWTGVIILLHYNPNGSGYTGANIPKMYWQLAAAVGFMSALWAVINFALHKNYSAERCVWMMSGFFNTVFSLLYMTIIIYMYAVTDIWASFTEDIKAGYNANLMGQQMIYEKIPIFGAMFTWFFAALIAMSMAGCCCFRGEYY